MNFDKPVKAKRYFSGKSIALCVAGIVILLIPVVVPDIDEFGRMFSFVLSGLFFFMAIYNFLRYKKSAPDAKVYQNLATAPVDIQVKYFEKILILSYFILPIFIFITAWELKEFEIGKTETLELWFPLAFIYNNAGYWPTVFSVLFLGIVCIIIFKCGINKLLERKQKQV